MWKPKKGLQRLLEIFESREIQSESQRQQWAREKKTVGDDNGKDTNEGSSGATPENSNPDTEITDSVDYPRLFTANLGLAIIAIGTDIADFSRNLERYSRPRRRATLFALDEQLEKLELVVGDGRNLVRGQAQAITLELSNAEGKDLPPEQTAKKGEK